MVEQVGSGISRIKKDLRDRNLPEPVYKTEGLFTVVFQRTEDFLEKTSVKTSVKILNLVNRNSNITISELASSLGKTTRAVEMSISKLKEQGKLERIGPDKGGYWKIVKNEE